jgi:hypothetical protein
MTTVAEVLAEHAITSSEEEIAAELRVLLGPPMTESNMVLTSAEDAFLAEYGGVRSATDTQLAALDARSAARVIAEVAATLTRTEAATLLGIDETRLSHRVRDGSIYTYPGAGGRRRYPDWQFHAGHVLPHLGQVLAVLPEHAHPVTIRSFMTVPDDTLVLHGTPASPAQWLAAGGAPEPVCALAATLGEQA